MVAQDVTLVSIYSCMAASNTSGEDQQARTCGGLAATCGACARSKAGGLLNCRLRQYGFADIQRPGGEQYHAPQSCQGPV